MNFQSTKTIELSGFSITIHSITEALRFEIRQAIAEYESAIYELQFQYEELLDSLKAKYSGPGNEFDQMSFSELSARERFDLNEFSRKMDQIRNDKIDPELVRRCLIAVLGVEVDGQPLSAADVRMGPPEVYEAVVREVRKSLGLTPAEVQNLESPSTSGAPVDGQTLLTIAPLAEGAEASPSGTAPSTIPIR